MAKLMQLEILTPDKSLLLVDNVSYLLAETVIGGVGVFANHAPLIATLREAPFKYQDDKGINHFIFIAGGFMEVNNNKVTILSVAAETAEAIDQARAEHAKAKAEARLANPEPTTDIAVVKLDLSRANGRLKTIAAAK